MFAVPMAINLAVILAAEVTLIWLLVRFRRVLAAVPLVVLNVCLAVDLAPLVLPRIVYDLTATKQLGEVEGELRAAIGATTSANHLPIQVELLGAPYSDPALFRDAFVEPPCADKCIELITSTGASHVQIRYLTDCDARSCERAGFSNGTGMERYWWYLDVRYPPIGCGESTQCRDSSIGRLSYEYSVNSTRAFQIRSVKYLERARWLSDIVIEYELLYVWPDNFPLRLTGTIYPAPLVLLPSVGGGNPFWNSAVAVEENYLRQHLLGRDAAGGQ